mmetsp:Transcript_16657/g.33432  ORF Transcript_16657/g.33432 Transcript_16657/m.33432 type:complete len:95 (-) Transcript_16657:169-453(-)
MAISRPQADSQILRQKILPYSIEEANDPFSVSPPKSMQIRTGENADPLIALLILPFGAGLETASSSKAMKRFVISNRGVDLPLLVFLNGMLTMP